MSANKGGLPRIYSKMVDEDGEKISTELETPDQVSIDVYDEKNKFSVVGMSPRIIKENAHRITDDLKEMSHGELRDLVDPDSTLNQIRLRFWAEYDEACFGSGRMSMARIVKGVCHPDQFKKLVKRPENLAYILCPIKSYEIQVQDFLETSLFKMRQALDKIKVENSKDMLAILKVYEVFDKRVHGDYTKNVKKEVKVIEENKGSAEIRQNLGMNKKLLIEQENDTE